MAVSSRFCIPFATAVVFESPAKAPRFRGCSRTDMRQGRAAKPVATVATNRRGPK